MFYFTDKLSHNDKARGWLDVWCKSSPALPPVSQLWNNGHHWAHHRPCSQIMGCLKIMSAAEGGGWGWKMLTLADKGKLIEERRRKKSLSEYG